jgi:hypothetical protein
MKKFFATLGALLVALVSLGGLVAMAPSASAYPAPVFDLSVDHQVLVGGNPVTATATASVTCHGWTLTFLDQSASANGTKFVHKFSTPVVQKKTVYNLRATCSYTAVSGRAGAAVMPVAQTWKGEIPITLLPKGSNGGSGSNGGGTDHNGVLPGTGGPGFWVLTLAILLLLGGVGTMVRSRRTHAPRAS